MALLSVPVEHTDYLYAPIADRKEAVLVLGVRVVVWLVVVVAVATELGVD